MGFIQRMATTRKVEMSEELRKEVETTYLHSTVSIIFTDADHLRRENLKKHTTCLLSW